MSTYSLSPYDNVNSGMTRTGAAKFPNPWFDIASEYIPTEINQIFDWCSFLYMSMGTWRSVSRRVCRYFLTELDITGESEEEREGMAELLNEKLHIMDELAQIGDEFFTYGNVFVSVYFPFERFLICPKCRTEYPITRIDYKFKVKDISFNTFCVKCKYDGAFNVDDRRSPDKDRIKIIRWNPKEIRLRVHPVSGRIEYYWEMPARFIDNITKGDTFAVNDTPMAMLKCLSSGVDKDSGMQKLFKFKPESIYHMKEATLSGVPIAGWGIPPIMPNFKLAYYIQVLRRYDEAIAMDYIIPFRVLYPTVGLQPQQDAVLSSNLSEFRGHMMRMVHERRRDPTNVQVAPFPIGYQMIGGEARAIAPKESIKFAIEELLNAAGYPAELYMGSLTVQSAPVALRLFERTQNALVSGFNDLVNWITKKIASQYMMGEMNAKLRSVTLADDLERKALQLQAAAGMDVSKSTAYSPFKIDYLEEQKKIIDEQTELQKMQQEASAKAQAAQMQVEAVMASQPGAGGGVPPAGGPAGMTGPGGEPGTPMELMQKAEEIANEMLFSMPDTLRRSQLIKLKQTNPTLHAQVKQIMEDKRQSMALHGQVQVQQQGQQAVQSGQPPPV